MKAWLTVEQHNVSVSEMSLDDYLKEHEIPGVQGIDTRALTRHLRTRGAMKACLTTEKMSTEQAVQRAVDLRSRFAEVHPAAARDLLGGSISRRQRRV